MSKKTTQMGHGLESGATHQDLQITMRKLEDLKAWDGNPRTHILMSDA